MVYSVKAQSAAGVDPNSIQSRAPLNADVELLVRRRPPGGVSLAHGQREHMLMSTVGRPVDGNDVHSVLRTATGRREWRTCPRGEVTFVPAGLPIEWDWSYESKSVHLTMLPAYLSDVGTQFELDDGESPRLRPLFRIRDDRLTTLLRLLRDEVSDSHIGTDLVTTSLLTLVAAQIYRLSRAELTALPDDRETIGFTADVHRRSIELLNDRLDEKISLADLADEFNLSPFHFARLFKRATGYPPHEYQLQLRITRARELLRSDARKTIVEIACELGFSDESHFRRHFRRIVGTTPSRYRAQQ